MTLQFLVEILVRGCGIPENSPNSTLHMSLFEAAGVDGAAAVAVAVAESGVVQMGVH